MTARGISLDFEFRSPIARVWAALTDSSMLEKWIYPNDFKAVVGHKFQFRAEPSQWWDGIIDGEVLEIEEPLRLRYTWMSGSEHTVVTWTLSEVEDGTTKVHLEHFGFEAEQSFHGATHGWQRMCGKLGSLLSELR